MQGVGPEGLSEKLFWVELWLLERLAEVLTLVPQNSRCNQLSVASLEQGKPRTHWDRCLQVKREMPCNDTGIPGGRWPRGSRGRGWRDAAASPQSPRTDGTLPGRGDRDTTRVSEWLQSALLWFEASQFVVLC